jgi:hypothetical protein
MRDKGEALYMPPIEPEHGYLIDTLLDAGPASPAGMGMSQLSWLELQAWQHGTGIGLDPWEARLIRALSGAYVQECRRAEAPDALPPWIEGDEDADRYRRARAARSLRDSMRAGV